MAFSILGKPQIVSSKNSGNYNIEKEGKDDRVAVNDWILYRCLEKAVAFYNIQCMSLY